MNRVSAKERLLGFFFPPRCPICRKVISSSDPLCPECRRKKPEEAFRRVYSLPGSGVMGFRTAAPMSFEGAYRNAIHRLKFRGKRGLSEPIGRLMAEAAELQETFDYVVWVPLSRKGKRRRGYDQSELLAKSAARALGIPVLPVLEKTRETKTQHELSRKEREKNVTDCYEVNPKYSKNIRGKNLLLVDDIITTGATLQECAFVLYEAGAGIICGLCAADAVKTQVEPQ